MGDFAVPPAHISLGRAQHHIWGHLAKNGWSEFGLKKTSKRPRSKDILPNEKSIHFICQGPESQEKTKEILQIKEDKRVVKISAMHGPGRQKKETLLE